MRDNVNFAVTCEPPDVTKARETIRQWERDSVCPMVAATEHACVWHCPVCNFTMPATIGSVSTHNYGKRLPVTCGLVRK